VGLLRLVSQCFSIAVPTPTTAAGFFHMSNKNCQDIMEKILNA
jgi:hypothetical protein